MAANKFHLSVSLSPGAIEYVNSLGEKHFSIALDKIILSHKQQQPGQQREEAVKQLIDAAEKLKRCDCPNEAILAWVQESIRRVKR
jgi:hypothetical protein